MLRPNIMAQFQCIQTCQVFLTIHQIQDEAEFIWSMEGISHTDNERTILELKKKIHKKSKSCSGKHIYYQTPSTHFFFSIHPIALCMKHRPLRGSFNRHSEVGLVP